MVQIPPDGAIHSRSDGGGGGRGRASGPDALYIPGGGRDLRDTRMRKGGLPSPPELLFRAWRSTGPPGVCSAGSCR